MRHKSKKKHWVTVSLSQEEFERLNAICGERAQSKADFLRSAMACPSRIPILRTRPNAENGRLRGACMKKHLTRLKREAKA